uniref:Uncharacterized protein n=1 Tax=Salix viminalis TaxID=40686 RepID=A0A6N2MP93_SALVM
MGSAQERFRLLVSDSVLTQHAIPAWRFQERICHSIGRLHFQPISKAPVSHLVVVSQIKSHLFEIITNHFSALFLVI